MVLKNKDSKNRDGPTSLEHLAIKLTQLVGIFRKGKWATDLKWWNTRSIFDPAYGYQDGKSLFDDIVQGILNQNSDMLSRHEVEKRIVFDFLEKQTVNSTEQEHLYNQSLVDKAKNLVKYLIEFEAWQTIDIPIANLWNKSKPFELGHVTFIGITEDELKKWKDDPVIWSPNTPAVGVLARVKAPGDRTRAIEYAITQVDLALDVLRAFLFPFGSSDTWKIGKVGDIIVSTSTPIRIDYKTHLSKLGSGAIQLDLSNHLLIKFPNTQLERIQKLILKTNRTPMESKLVNAIHWLAESTKLDNNDAKFAKICFALEALLGSEPEAEELKVRGITAMLAERAAFVGGKDFEDRFTIDKQIRKYYGIRSKIVHEGAGNVKSDDIDEFGELTRNLVFDLLIRLDELGTTLKDVNKLEDWVKKQRYTLP